MSFVKTTLQILVAAIADAAEVKANKVTSFQSTPDHIHFPSEKLVKDSLDAISVPTLPRVAYIDAAYTGNIFPYFNTWAAARAALLALTPAPDVTHPCWAVRFSAADGTQISLGGDTAESLVSMGILLRDGLNGAVGPQGPQGIGIQGPRGIQGVAGSGLSIGNLLMLLTQKTVPISFAGAVFINQDLTDATLGYADFSGASFQGSDLSRAYLGFAILTNVQFGNAILNTTNFERTNLTTAVLDSVTIFTGASFHTANITNKDFSNKNLTNVIFTNANLTGVYFDSAILTGANLSGANCVGASFVGTTMPENADTKTKFKAIVGANHWDAGTTIWIDGDPIGA